MVLGFNLGHLKRPAAHSPLKRPAAEVETSRTTPPQREVKPEPKLPLTPEEETKEVSEHEEQVLGKKPVFKKPSSKPSMGTPKKQADGSGAKGGKVVKTISKKNGWTLMQYETANGRRYWKWAHIDGRYCFSKVQAEQLGFVDEDA